MSHSIKHASEVGLSSVENVTNPKWNIPVIGQVHQRVFTVRYTLKDGTTGRIQLRAFLKRKGIWAYGPWLARVYVVADRREDDSAPDINVTPTFLDGMEFETWQQARKTAVRGSTLFVAVGTYLWKEARKDDTN